MSSQSPCPCGANASYDACCGKYHNQSQNAPTAEALMRSRYSAFALGYFDYIAATQRLINEPDIRGDDIAQSNGQTQWLELEINDTQDGQEDDMTGMVAFTAHFQEGQHSGQLQERSLFEKVDGRWLYIAGEHEVKPATKAVEKVGRNDPCTCGSGKKYKKCCG
ncbi:YchJ family protein [Marinomonas ostreistagni]|uniref:YchJ family protein n=1 Tax=Marinomonas ostreistagni TaxID=359209 RepID=UPI00194FD554|nr:YchJ family protein [Marinomonas ostreistagni]MBM6550214.1 YchJ family protein [Marinomonas ostreistagni]